jgi:hypothetical protein
VLGNDQQPRNFCPALDALKTCRELSDFWCNPFASSTVLKTKTLTFGVIWESTCDPGRVHMCNVPWVGL